MSTVGASSNQNGGATRSPLACLPCRSRHLKCDGKRPKCNRCDSAATECHYAPSRRGGLDRAALAERRKRLAAAGNDTSVDSSRSQSRVSIRSTQGHGFQLASEEFAHRLSSLDGITLGSGNPAARVSSISQQPDNINSDLLVDAYYKSFHKFHPFLVPQGHFASFCQDPGRETSLKPLIAVMRLVGNIYIAQEWSAQLKEQVESCFSEANQAHPTMVQCRLLYSVALFWYSYKDEAKQQMDLAVRLALDLEMFQQGFARAHGAEDPVLIESWRRTWWELYIIDAYYAGTLGTLNFTVVDIDATVELPCEEWEYESGDIPQPKTLEDFDYREFNSEDTSFSSFTYLISAVRCAALAISTAPKVSSREDSTHIIQTADSVIEGWSLLLPQDRKQVMTKAGEIDELLFQAHLLINVATIGLHRPLSDLRFNPVEDVSSCAREPPPENSKPELINVHTVRVLRSVEAQIRLLALPARPFRHTPFVTCMTSEGTLALLSACNFLLKGKELAIAREQIRMTIGCLKTLGEIWPRTARNVQEIQTIARHVLRLGPRATSNINHAKSSSAPSLSTSEGRLGPQTEPPTSENDVFSSFGSMDDVCGWYSLEDLGPHFAEWIGNEQ
ncbi:C6 transcription factor [Colletotrichum tofieldiae]|uniref:C6 transcription factor n=1 Tax=Colletotrichum tofieldiae TaxID=708197 RepID=A0A166WN93_9PEZI|nr:C6 transcription factor [Colletotrichum tofieldiae]